MTSTTGGLRGRITPNLDLRPERRAAYLDQVRVAPAPDRRPNVLLVLLDDLGQGDFSCFGARAIETPRIDALAAEGVVLDTFYSSCSVCTGSRFGLLTGRYPVRGFIHSVFFPSVTTQGRAFNAAGFPRGVRGILDDEISLADAFQAAGYRTGLFGKWHLGDHAPHWPNDRGFDEFFGSPYSNDMDPYEFWRNREVAIPAPVDQKLLTTRLTTEIGDFVARSGDQPFLAVYASPFPHDPVHAGAPFVRSSQAGTYGDCVQELDWSVGELVDRLDAAGKLDDTIVIVTSDNGPWYEGSPGFHRGRKGNAFDGGQLVPFIARWPGWAAGLRTDVPAMNIDLFPTLAATAGIPLPTDRVIDGVDLTPLLTGASTAPLHDELLFLKNRVPLGIRSADGFKYFRRSRSENATYAALKQGPFLFRTDVDHNESYDVTAHHPDRALELQERLDAWIATLDADPRGWLDPPQARPTTG